MARQIHDTKEKLSYYRRRAADAERNANAATDADVESSYFAIQRTWNYLAEELEREMALAAGSLIIADDVFVPTPKNSPSHKIR